MDSTTTGKPSRGGVRSEGPRAEACAQRDEPLPPARLGRLRRKQEELVGVSLRGIAQNTAAAHR